MRVGRQRRESDVVVNIVGGEVLFFFCFFLSASPQEPLKY